MTTPLDNSTDEILAEEYLGLGITGKSAIHAMWEDYAEGRMSDWLDETDTTETELLGAMLRFTHDIIAGNYQNAVRTPEGWK